jgi:hypothetical protein
VISKTIIETRHVAKLINSEKPSGETTFQLGRSCAGRVFRLAHVSSGLGANPVSQLQTSLFYFGTTRENTAPHPSSRRMRNALPRRKLQHLDGSTGVGM